MKKLSENTKKAVEVMAQHYDDCVAYHRQGINMGCSMPNSKELLLLKPEVIKQLQEAGVVLPQLITDQIMLEGTLTQGQGFKNPCKYLKVENYFGALNTYIAEVAQSKIQDSAQRIQSIR